MSHPLLSVVMPVFNAERFLAEAIKSVLIQTVHDFEFIIVDDGSTDCSPLIISSFNDPRIVVLTNATNRGITASLNYGLRAAKSDLIVRMDADDICYCERFEKQLQFISENPDGALWGGWARVISEEGKVLKLEKLRPEYYYFNLIFEMWLYHPTLVFDRKKIAGLGNYTVPYGEDYELVWQVSRLFKIHIQPLALIDYRVSKTSLHNVLKKDEYGSALRQMVLRNIRFYMGEYFQLDDCELECLRHNFKPLLRTRDVSSVVRCLELLEIIKFQVINTDNCNNNPEKILEAVFYKRAFIINFFLGAFPPIEAFALARKTDSLTLYSNIVKTNKIKPLLQGIVHNTVAIFKRRRE